MLLVTPYGGLSNRLRVIFSYQLHAKESGKVLQVNWSPDNCVSGAIWDDVFEPIAGVKFVSIGRADVGRTSGGGGAATSSKGKPARPSVRTCKPLSWNTSSKWKPLYKQLKLKHEHQNKLHQTLAKLGADYIAVHVRRTDHLLAATAAPDNVFFDFIDALPTVCRIYVATDNSVTLNQFVRKYGEHRVIRSANFRKLGNGKTSYRNTSLADAAIDLFICAGAKSSHFMGTPHSSFSEAIATLNGLKSEDSVCDSSSLQTNFNDCQQK